MPKAVEAAELPKGIRPYSALGVELVGGEQRSGDCPLCGASGGKFRVNSTSGLWDCKRCGESGNPLSFLRKYWQSLDLPEQEAKTLASDRGLLGTEALNVWGVRLSRLTGGWLVPGFSPEGQLWQLYRWSPVKGGKYALKPVPGVHPDGSAHGIHGAFPLGDRPSLWICEGPWDGMAVWEVMKLAKETDTGLAVTGIPSQSLLATTSVIAVPGCETFRKQWVGVAKGRQVVFAYDSDHPREMPPGSGRWSSAGARGTKKAYTILREEGVTDEASIRWINWGEGGYDPSLPDGYDLRDALREGGTPRERVAALAELGERIAAIPGEGGEPVPGTKTQRPRIEPEACTSWTKLLNAWRKALRMRPSLEDALAVVLAVSVSTLRKGDQLFLQLIGDAGSAKTRICDAMLVSSNCYPLEHLTGFHSGWKDESGEDYSLLARINRKTLITPEGDVLMSSPHFTEIMSQQRRIFDGTSGASYKNRKEDQRYTGLRTPWIIAGTPALMDTDQSRLGDRFLRVYIEPPDDEGKKNILTRVGYSALQSVMEESNSDPAGGIEEKLLEAYQLTGGYLDWLWENASDLLASLRWTDHGEGSQEGLIDRCSRLAELTADLRARPNSDPRKQEAHDTKELPTRLTHQFVRLACCLAIATGKGSVDETVMARVRKVAIDTSRGRSQVIVRKVAQAGDKGITSQALAVACNEQPGKLRPMLSFLRKIGVLDFQTTEGKVRGITPQARWILTPRVAALWPDFEGMESPSSPPSIAQNGALRGANPASPGKSPRKPEIGGPGRA